MKLTTREMILASLFTALTVVGAKINLLLPGIPVTMQSIVVMLSGCFLNKQVSFLSQLVYILLGLIGIPVFAKPSAGPAYIMLPSFGYLIGFLFGAYVIGLVIEKFKKKTLPVYLLANFSGLFIIYLFGISHIYLLKNILSRSHMNLVQIFNIGVLPFLLKDVLLSVLVSILASILYKRIGYLAVNIRHK